MFSRPLPCRYWGRRINADEEVIRGNALRLQKRSNGVPLARRVGQGRPQVCGLHAEWIEEAQTFGDGIFWDWMIMPDQHSVEERTWKARKCQAVFSPTQVGQECT